MDEQEAREMILRSEIDRLQMSNTKLIAELGMIADKLGVPPSMKAVLDAVDKLTGRIESLSDPGSQYE
jgi:hypothetical protein